MKTVVSIPDPVFDAAERISKRLGVSRSRLYTMAIERMVNSQRSRGVQEALDATPVPRANSTGPGKTLL